MKSFMLFIFLVASFSLSAEVKMMPPLWKETPERIHIRCQVAHVSFYRMTELLEFVDASVREDFIREFNVLKFCMGYPVYPASLPEGIQMPDTCKPET